MPQLIYCFVWNEAGARVWLILYKSDFRYKKTSAIFKPAPCAIRTLGLRVWI